MLRESRKIKTVSGATQFSLTAPANKSYRIRDIHVLTPVTEYATLKIDRVTVGYFRVGGGVLGNHLPFPIADEENTTLFKWCQDYLGWSPIPLQSGETFTITGVHQASSLVTVEYDEYDAGDVRNTEVNGSQAKRFQFVNYGRYSTTLAAGENRYVTHQSPVDYPAFPFGDVVPSNMAIKIQGIVASDVNRATTGTSNEQRSTNFKLVRNRKTLFDDDLNGLPLFGSATFVSAATSVGNGQSIIGNYDDTDRRLPWVPEQPLEFSKGDALDLYITTAVLTGAANIPAASAEVGLLMDVSMIG